MNTLVIACKSDVKVYLIKPVSGLVNPEPFLVLPKGITNEQINEKIREAGHRWELHDNGNRCDICGGPRPCLRED